jgi:hypothetical protein
VPGMVVAVDFSDGENRSMAPMSRPSMSMIGVLVCVCASVCACECASVCVSVSVMCVCKELLSAISRAGFCSNCDRADNLGTFAGGCCCCWWCGCVCSIGCVCE